MSNLVPLRDVVHFHYGSALKAEDRDESGLFAVFGSNGPVGRHSQQLVNYPTIIIGRKGSVGSVYYAEEGGWPIDTTYYTELLDKKRVHLRYLYYALNQAGLDRHTIVTSIPGLNRDALYRTKIPLPPLPEQKRIAGILDKADAIRRKRREARDATSEMSMSAFRETFRNYLTPDAAQSLLSDVAEVVSGVAKGRKLDGAETREVPYLRVANVQAGYLDLSEIKTIPAKESEVRELALQHGDVVMTEGGDHDKLGRGALWEHDVPDCIHQNHVFRVRTNRQKLLSTFFVHYLQTELAKGYFLRCAKKTTNLASINMTQLRALPVSQPPLKLQERFDGELRTIREVIDRQDTAQKDADCLFSSLVQRAFRGEL